MGKALTELARSGIAFVKSVWYVFLFVPGFFGDPVDAAKSFGTIRPEWELFASDAQRQVIFACLTVVMMFVWFHRQRVRYETEALPKLSISLKGAGMIVANTGQPQRHVHMVTVKNESLVTLEQCQLLLYMYPEEDYRSAGGDGTPYYGSGTFTLRRGESRDVEFCATVGTGNVRPLEAPLYREDAGVWVSHGIWAGCVDIRTFIEVTAVSSGSAPAVSVIRADREGPRWKFTMVKPDKRSRLLRLLSIPFRRRAGRSLGESQA